MSQKRKKESNGWSRLLPKVPSTVHGRKSLAWLLWLLSVTTLSQIPPRIQVPHVSFHCLYFESLCSWPSEAWGQSSLSPPLGLAIRIACHGDHLLLTCDFGVLEDAIPNHASWPHLFTAAEEVGDGIHTALDVGAAQEGRAVAADLLQPPQDQVGFSERQEERVVGGPGAPSSLAQNHGIIGFWVGKSSREWPLILRHGS